MNIWSAYAGFSDILLFAIVGFYCTKNSFVWSGKFILCWPLVRFNDKVGSKYVFIARVPQVYLTFRKRYQNELNIGMFWIVLRMRHSTFSKSMGIWYFHTQSTHGVPKRVNLQKNAWVWHLFFLEVNTPSYSKWPNENFHLWPSQKFWLFCFGLCSKKVKNVIFFIRFCFGIDLRQFSSHLGSTLIWQIWLKLSVSSKTAITPSYIDQFSKCLCLKIFKFIE